MLLAGAMIAFALYNLVRWVWASHSLKTDAEDEFAARGRDRPGTIDGVSKSDFVSLYVKAFQPRSAIYIFGAITSILLVSPFALTGVSLIYEQIWRARGAQEVEGAIGYVYMFSLAFGMALVAAIIVAAFAQVFHKRAPEPFNHALARARGEPLPDREYRRRPKWARHIKPKPASDD